MPFSIFIIYVFVRFVNNLFLRFVENHLRPTILILCLREGIGKMLWNGQTEPAGVTRSCTRVQREVKFVHSKKAINQRKIPFCGIFLHLVSVFGILTIEKQIIYCLFAFQSILTFPYLLFYYYYFFNFVFVYSDKYSFLICFVFPFRDFACICNCYFVCCFSCVKL